MIKRNVLLCLLFILIHFGLAAGEKPRLILHFDMNGTLIVSDKAGEKTKEEVIFCALAEKHKDRWDERVPEPITYVEYVKKFLLPGLPNDKALKRLRIQKIGEFLLFLQQTDHPLKDQVQQEFSIAFKKLETQRTLVLPSFYMLVDYLNENEYDYSIVIRTFGYELDEVMNEIERMSDSIVFSKKGHFKERILHLSDDVKINDHSSFYTLLKTHRHIGIQDDWLPWINSKEKQEHAKVFPIDLDDLTTVSLFFDDNILVDDSSGRNIVNPIDVRSQEFLAVKTLIEAKRLFPVATLEALVDEHYYIRMVALALEVGVE